MIKSIPESICQTALSKAELVSFVFTKFSHAALPATENTIQDITSQQLILVAEHRHF